VIGNVTLIVAGGQRSADFKHQDRRTICAGRSMFGVARNGVRLTGVERDLVGAGGIAKTNSELAVDHEEELIGVVVLMPHVLSLDLRNSHVVVVDPPNNARAPLFIERGECCGKVDGAGMRKHAKSMGLAGQVEKR
jgi:hypothetical protein